MTRTPVRLIKAVTLARARRLRRAQTDAERKLWTLLRDRGLGVKFRRQHPIGSFIVDFCCVDHQLAIELDGSQHATRTAADQERTHFLNAKGYRVLRFWNDDVLQNPESVAEAILKAI